MKSGLPSSTTSAGAVGSIRARVGEADGADNGADDGEEVDYDVGAGLLMLSFPTAMSPRSSISLAPRYAAGLDRHIPRSNPRMQVHPSVLRGKASFERHTATAAGRETPVEGRKAMDDSTIRRPNVATAESPEELQMRRWPAHHLCARPRPGP